MMIIIIIITINITMKIIIEIVKITIFNAQGNLNIGWHFWDFF